LKKIKCAFEFVCNKNWDELAPTASPLVKFCGTCSHDVFLCSSQSQVDEATKLKRCIAIDNNLQQESVADVSIKLLGIPSGRKSINEIFGFSDTNSENESKKPRMVIRETFKHPDSNHSINLEPLPEKVIDQLLKEADELYAKSKSYKKE
jgi:hypothetical protein